MSIHTTASLVTPPFLFALCFGCNFWIRQKTFTYKQSMQILASGHLFAAKPLSFGIALVLPELVLPSYSVGQLVCKPF